MAMPPHLPVCLLSLSEWTEDVLIATVLPVGLLCKQQQRQVWVQTDTPLTHHVPDSTPGHRHLVGGERGAVNSTLKGVDVEYSACLVLGLRIGCGQLEE